jgi:6,7-dimethyl-8-ribityllumazine synthase
MTRLETQPAASKFSAVGLRFGIVVSRFNNFITDRLLSGALDALRSAGARENDIEVIHVPGAFEIPIVSKKLAKSGRVNSIVAIGCVLRGETSHYDYICSEVARGVLLAQMETGVPVIFCVLTCDTQEQAIARSGGKDGGNHGNKGFDGGLSAVEMANLSRELDAPKKNRSHRQSKGRTASRRERRAR